MYVTQILLLLLASNAFADGSEDWQALFSNMGINTKETSCVVQNFKANLDTLMSLANKQHNEKTPTLTPLAGCQMYHMSNTMTTFWSAVSTCRDMGMRIATPDTSDKMNCLRAQLRIGGTTFNYWIGATNTNRDCYYWVTTNQILNVPCNSDLPNSCLFISSSPFHGSVRNTTCTSRLQYICERA